MAWLDGYHTDASQKIALTFVDDGMRGAWSELALSRADWDELKATPTGLILLARRDSQQSNRYAPRKAAPRYVPGVTPVLNRNARMKRVALLKPTAAATASTVIGCSRNNVCAVSMRRRSTY
jgi:hypothetical protein